MKSKPVSPPEETKQLLICRHAKSSWRDASLSDIQRPLNKRGERDAPEMGRRLARRGIRPDLIMTSPAVRAKITAEHYAAQLGYPLPRLRVHADQYAAAPATLLNLVQTLDPGLVTVLMVGHNPESTILANMLGNLGIANIPTSGIVALEFPVVSWGEITEGTGFLHFFDYPKKV
ncbi:SixA phosphatase family protein [Desulfobulbus alkaliphilus]|uniref:SixA phosphatase family protein n=1 Tax=Desulfobulbus alkaliphilus TaxID=869814 RepID=UPI001962EF8D|nr:histidine phosphatase family protein [Desulfobulbus alkaliphilus]MBM9535484.1 histidine phosphatase family protein [Desulfobulbus alkaliphilus]